MQDEVVLFLSGMRINRPWKVHRWVPVLLAMRRMLKWLDRHPEAGLLSWHYAWIRGPAVVQHWRSRADCERFARAAAQPHLPVWKWFHRAVGASGDVGIWHETYPVRGGECESFYANMPPMGLALAAARRRLAQPAVHRLAAEQGRVHDRVG